MHLLPATAARSRGRFVLAVLMVISCVCLRVAPSAGAFAPGQNNARFRLQSAFTHAAHEFRVPASVLLAVSYNVSRWDDHHGAPSTSGGYGPMHLTHVDLLPADAKGSGPALSVRSNPAFHTLDAAAHLLREPVGTLERDARQNIRGGAALLARYAGERTSSTPAPIPEWFGAIARYSGSQDASVAFNFARAVYATIRHGAAHLTLDGQEVRLRGQHVTMDTRTGRGIDRQPKKPSKAECPPNLGCTFVPAAYTVNSPGDPTDYGNYDVANRGKDGLAIRYIVIHDTESPYANAIQGFQNPTRYASSNYVIRSSDGQITQMVRNENVAWHAGNYYVNAHAIGIEHEGVAIEGATWYGEQLYQSSATLVRYLASRYNIPLDRGHIVGHDEVPGPTPSTQTSQHWDPGPFWDWSHYMDLLKAPIAGTADMSQSSDIITINPTFATNQPTVKYCNTASDCRTVAPQSSNFVYLYAAPRTDAPLLSDPALHPTGVPGTTKADDWGDKAVTGQQFYRVDQRDGWDAINYAGQKAWFYNPGGNTVTVPGSGQLVTPRDGRTSIPVYGRAYPSRSDYPTWVPRKQIEKIVPLQYSIPAGQTYVVADQMTADLYWSPTQTKRALIQGKTLYYQIFFNHRFAFVKAADMSVVPGAVLRR